MKERPIIFSGPMVRAILEGRKTQTRRVVKPQPTEIDGQLRTQSAMLLAAIFGREATKADEESFAPKCPYGVPGDRLWCKETFAHGAMGPIYRADWGEPVGNNYPAHRTAAWLSEIQKACGADVLSHEWKSPIHMPRWASRITLEIESVRVERLQDISEADAMAELGANPSGTYPAEFGYHNRLFADLWESIHGKGSWKLNPWVWVLSFKKV